MPWLWATYPYRSLRKTLNGKLLHSRQGHQPLSTTSVLRVLPDVLEDDVCELSGNVTIGELNRQRV